MNKKKSQEYLKKINDAFTALSEQPYEIEIDSLLGYVRIFYSSLKEIPTQISDPVKSDIVEPKVSVIHHVAIQPESSTEDNTFDLQNEKETIVVNDAAPAAPIHPEVEAIENLAPLSSDKDHSININVSNDASPTPTIHSESTKSVTEEVKDEYVPTSETEKEEVFIQTPVNDFEEGHNTEQVHEVEEIQIVETSHHELVEETNQFNPEKLDEDTDRLIKDSSAVEIIETVPLSPKPEDDRITSVSEIYRPKATVQYDNENDAIDNLFRDKSPTGLVDFLGLSPLDNLNKAWGLNDKMLIIKDLFDNDMQAFETTIEAINKTTSMREAKAYLIDHVVRRFEWHDLSKLKRATNFIMQTKRLFVDK